MSLIPAPDAPRMPTVPQALGPIGWLFKLLMLFGKVLYYVVRLVIWILRRIFPGK